MTIVVKSAVHASVLHVTKLIGMTWVIDVSFKCANPAIESCVSIVMKWSNAHIANHYTVQRVQ